MRSARIDKRAFGYLYPSSKDVSSNNLPVTVMNYQTYSTRREFETKQPEEEKQAERPQLTESQKRRAELIKRALNRTARERRMALHR
ncbi:hypothetical protein QEH56_15635 [Pelagicoccus enzymogenes]|nr:hypothetical protein [Pelagicoccus enzymogenes]MDQ8199594.1 hypothetical protein [Pelagicoccus enzymogenes]